jgi:hypothetical protein
MTDLSLPSQVLDGDALAVLRGLAVPRPVAPPEGQPALFGAEEQP